MIPEQPLRYPPGFPPTGRWDRFFMGVRWLGPDLSFLKELRTRQSQRTVHTQVFWGGGERSAMAATVGEAFARYCDWPTPYFLPGDSVQVVANGPAFGWIHHADDHDAIGAIEEAIGTRMGDAFWREIGASTMGDLVDRLLAAAHGLEGTD